MWKTGASCAGQKVLDRELFEAYKVAGFDMMEISLGEFNGVDASKAERIKEVFVPQKVRKLSEEAGVGLWSLHLPFGYEFSPTNPKGELLSQMIKLDSELLEMCAEAGVKIAVIHPSTEPILDSDREEYKKLSCETLFVINEVAKKCGVTLAVENLPRTCLGRTAEEMKLFLDIDPSIGVCFDVNHLLCQSHRDFVKSVGDRIITTHISDYDFIDERHWVPGHGQIDWMELVELLKEVNYQGVFMNEVEAKTDRQHKPDVLTYKELHDANMAIFEKYYNK